MCEDNVHQTDSRRSSLSLADCFYNTHGCAPACVDNLWRASSRSAVCRGISQLLVLDSCIPHCMRFITSVLHSFPPRFPLFVPLCVPARCFSPWFCSSSFSFSSHLCHTPSSLSWSFSSRFSSYSSPFVLLHNV